MNLLLSFLFIILILYCFLSFFEVRNSRDTFEFTYPWSWWMGAFVWEDVLVYSFLFIILTIITWISHDLRVGLMLYAIFWIVRSTGESLYFFLQQFHEPVGVPHGLSTHFKKFEPILGNISLQKGYILMQIIHQSVVILAISGLGLLFLNWEKIPSWF